MIVYPYIRSVGASSTSGLKKFQKCISRDGQLSCPVPDTQDPEALCQLLPGDAEGGPVVDVQPEELCQVHLRHILTCLSILTELDFILHVLQLANKKRDWVYYFWRASQIFKSLNGLAPPYISDDLFLWSNPSLEVLTTPRINANAAHGSLSRLCSDLWN